MVVLASYYEINDIGAHHFRTKIIRALVRSPLFRDNTFKVVKKTIVNGAVSVAFRVDTPRFTRVMEKTARALHFHERGTKLMAPLRIYTRALSVAKEDAQRELDRLDSIGNQLFAMLPSEGTNPLVFTYQFTSMSSRDAHILRMSFYEGCHVYALWGSELAPRPRATNKRL